MQISFHTLIRVPQTETPGSDGGARCLWTVPVLPRIAAVIDWVVVSDRASGSSLQANMKTRTGPTAGNNLRYFR